MAKVRCGQGRGRFGFYLGLVLLLIQGMVLGLAGAQSVTPSKVFFSQGQAVANPEDPTKSQREALRDLQLQAIAQAASVLLSPAQMEREYPLIQEKILRQPQRYVQSYQIFSETSAAGGLHQIVGQVTISMDLLKKDLMALPPVPVDREAGAPSRPGPPGQGNAVGGAPAEASRAGAMSGQVIFWAVAENWEENWHLPGDQRDPEGPFGASVAMELQAYGYTLQFPKAGTLVPDADGEVAVSQALAQASVPGLRHVVVGRVGPGADETDKARTTAVLRLLKTESGRSEGEIHREIAIGEATSHEAAIELASFIAPQLERQLRTSAEPETAGEPEPAGEPEIGERVVQPEEAGELVVQIKSPDAYGDWLAVETKIREQVPNLQVKGLELGPEGSLVRLLGADGSSLRKLHGMQLANGAQVQVASLDADGHAWRITLTKPVKSPAEPQP